MNQHFSRAQALSVIVLRLFIGWHFLYEGVVKAYNPTWTAKGYLAGSESFLSGFYQWLASDALVGYVDKVNILMLIGVGLGLLLQVWQRGFALMGIALLALYYLAYPAIPGIATGPTEGNYWLVNKNLIELAGLWVLYAFAHIGYDDLVRSFKKSTKKETA